MNKKFNDFGDLWRNFTSQSASEILLWLVVSFFSLGITFLLMSWGWCVFLFLIIFIGRFYNMQPRGFIPIFAIFIAIQKLSISNELLTNWQSFWAIISQIGTSIMSVTGSQLIAGATVTQASATIALFVITCVYVKELQTSRKQLQKPYVYVFFYWTQNLGKFMAILKNVGSGAAFDINYSYELVDNEGKKITHSDKCRILANGEETVDMTPFFAEHMNSKNNVKVEICYKDSFYQVVKDQFEHNLRELANNPPPSRYAEFRRTSEKEPSPFQQEAKESLLMELLSKATKALEGIRDKFTR